MNNNTCCVCQKMMGNTYSLCIIKDDEKIHTCSYDCNLNVSNVVGEDYWDYVMNKTDFIQPFVKPVKKIIKQEFNFTEHENDVILDRESYENQYEIYLENKRIDEIMDNYSEKSSNYSEEDDY